MKKAPRILVICGLAAATALFTESCSNPEGPGIVDQTPGAADPEVQNQASSAGDYARDYLTDASFQSVVVEVDWVAGQEPDDSALGELVDTLEEVCRKDGGVQIFKDDEIPDAGSPVWTLAQINDLEREYRDLYRDASTGVMTMYVLYVDGNSDRDSGSGKVLGIAYHGSSTVLFRETISNVEPSVPLFAGIEETVLRHEAGHLLGLVENGIPMTTDHRDPEHGAHDSSDECLMHWTIETQSVVDVLLQGRPDFDAACRADMIAAGGRPAP